MIFSRIRAAVHSALCTAVSNCTQCTVYVRVYTVGLVAVDTTTI